MEKLKKQAGSDSGVYYVFLPNGRLQKVEYATAPVQSAEKQQRADGENQAAQQKEAGIKEPNIHVAQFAQAQLQMMPQPLTNYVASVQFSDVPPLNPPIYSYNPNPLVRIVRRA
ncbi:hypothetical protein AAG570_001306 [Ranatra chinensis]|uniref:Uncharacterized protein n=1 Tax=Ranatra chinensis TaxID=642074 RepID=A0ABD0YBR4_9HEMI